MTTTKTTLMFSRMKSTQVTAQTSMTLTRPTRSVKTVRQFVMFSSRDQPQDRGARSSQPRMAPTVVGRSKSQRRDSVGGNEAHEAADKGKVVEYKPRKQGASTRQSRCRFPTGMVCTPNTMLFIRLQVSSRNSASQAETDANLAKHGAVSKKRAARRKAFAAKAQQNLQRKPSRTKAEVKAEIHVEEAKAAE